MAVVKISTRNTYPSTTMGRELANKFSHRLPSTITVSETFATALSLEGAPLITVADGSETLALIAIEGIEIEGSKDVLGLPQRVFHPHVVKVVLNDTVATPVLYGALLGEIYKLGTKVEIMTATNDEEDDDGDMIPTGIPVEADLENDPLATWFNDPFWPNQNSL